MNWLRQDLKFAIRALWRRPGFSGLAVLTLALGLGVNTIAFSAVNALVYKPFRFDGADRIGWLFVGTAGDVISDTSLPMFEHIAAHSRTLEAVAAEGRVPLARAADGTTEEVWALLVSPQYFSIVTPTPRAGRMIGGSDGDRGDVPVVVSERFWQRRFAAASDLNAVTLMLNGQRAHVVGVMPDHFQGPGGLFEPDMWIPLAARRTLALPPRYETATNDWLTLIARPAAGVSRDALEAETLAIAQSADASTGAPPARERRVRYERLIDRHPEVREIARGGIIGLLLVTLVLFIACFNVAGLVLARSAERRRELSVRASLGASRARLARQLLTEGLVLAVLAGAAAVVVSTWSASLLAVFSLPSPIPQRLHFVTDWRVVAFASAAVVVAAVLPALAPLVTLVRTDLARWLGTAGTAGAGVFAQRRTRRAFVVVQVAGSTILLAAALLFARHFVAQAQGDPGFDVDHIALMQIDPTQYGYSTDAARSFSTAIAQRVAAMPGVRAAAVADRVSFYVGQTNVRQISASGRDCPGGPDCQQAGRYVVSREYFDAMGIPMTLGRPFAAGERDAAVVSAFTAATLWPGASPLGQSFKVHPEGVWLRVIGVAADVKHRAINEKPQPYFYQPLDHTSSGQATIVARGSGDPSQLILPLRQAAHAIDPRVPPQSIHTMEERMAMPLWPARTTAGFVGACGIIAVVLSAIGLFGVTYFTVGQRRREFGVRLAIGADGRTVQRQVVMEAFTLAAPGIVIGVLAAVVSGMWLRSIFVSLETTAALPYVVAAAAQAAVMIFASFAPARAAARSNPVDVLRAE